MDDPEKPSATPAAETTPRVPTLEDLREVNEGLLLAGLREQELVVLLEDERAQLAVILDSIEDALLVVDPQGQPVLVNAAYTHLMRSPTGTPVLEGSGGEPLPSGDDLASRVARGEAFALDFSILAPAGTRTWYEARGRPITSAAGPRGVVVVIRDISARHERETALHHQALHDTLTGLPNRTLFYDRLDQAVRAARRTHTPIAVLLLDVDHFKEVNDTHGHLAGDQLLQEVATRLTQVVRASDTVARLGGDEFVVLLPNTDHAGIEEIVDKICAHMVPAIPLEGVALQVVVSIGSALAAGGHAEAQALLRQADAAMYAAKHRRNAPTRSAQDHRGPPGITAAAELGAAIAVGDLVVHYQPQVGLAGARDAAEGSLVGVEALVRWAHPARGLLLPPAFILLAERSGLIVPLLAWVLEEALTHCALWAQTGRGLALSVNLSLANLQDPALPDTIADVLARHGFPATLLRLELTESMVMTDPGASARVLTTLRDLGVHVALDNFGTGVSSLAYLTRLPVDELKIDRSFLRGTDAPGAAVIQAIVTLGHELGMRVVAQGVETRETYRQVEQLGCDAAQGYYVGWPLSAAAFDRQMAAVATPASGL